MNTVRFDLVVESSRSAHGYVQFLGGDTEAQVKMERVWVGMAPRL